MRRTLAAFLTLLALTACDSSSSLKDLRHTPPGGDAYAAALATEYKDLSEEKLISYDWWTSKYFADKGLLAAHGREVGPEDPAQWKLPADKHAEFLEARVRLVDAVAANRLTNPAGAAKATVAYDRWVELQDRNWDGVRIQQAHDDFFRQLEALERQGTTAASNTQAVESTSAILYFPFDSEALTDSAKAAIGELVDYVRLAGPTMVTINGHADRVGSEEYNMALSERRARFVMRALEQAGLPRDALQYFAFGETDPKVPTPDHTPEPQNRRVEIFLE